MKLLRSDLARNFSIGFLAGSLIVLGVMAPDLLTQIVPEAAAATLR